MISRESGKPFYVKHQVLILNKKHLSKQLLISKNLPDIAIVTGVIVNIIFFIPH